MGTRFEPRALPQPTKPAKGSAPLESRGRDSGISVCAEAERAVQIVSTAARRVVGCGPPTWPKSLGALNAVSRAEAAIPVFRFARRPKGLCKLFRLLPEESSAAGHQLGQRAWVR